MNISRIWRRSRSLSEIRKLNENLENKILEVSSRLAFSEKKYGNLFENNPLPMFILDRESLKFLEVNKASVICYGYSGVEFCNMTVMDLTSPEDRQKMLSYLSELHDEYGKLQMLRHRKKNGDVIYVELITHSVEVNDRKTMLALINDITISKIAEDEIKAVNDSLEKKVKERTRQLEFAHRDKSEFITNMSNELWTSMNALLGNSELLGSVVKEPDQNYYLASIRSGGRDMLAMINDVLDLSKIEAGKLELKYEYVNTETFFSEFRRVFSAKISEKKINLIIDVSSEVIGSIYVDEWRLRQVIMSLLGNAVKFTEKGVIQLEAYSENKHIFQGTEGETELFDLIIEVSDTGIGIPEESHTEVFSPFFQIKTHLNQAGTGLGLAIVQKLLELMNGTITLDSKSGKGSKFTVRIPNVTYKPNNKIQNAPVIINRGNLNFENAVILVADDVENNRKYIKDILGGTSLTVLEADNGTEAFDLIEKINPQLVIADINMPGMSGFELLDKLKSNERLKLIPVVAYSASIMKEQKELILKSDFSGFLIKPVQVADLYDILMKVLPHTRTNPEGPVIDKNVPETTNDIFDFEGLNP